MCDIDGQKNKYSLHNDDTLAEEPILQAEAIIELLEVCLKNHIISSE
jgi:hypothetical protein